MRAVFLFFFIAFCLPLILIVSAPSGAQVVTLQVAALLPTAAPIPCTSLPLSPSPALLLYLPTLNIPNMNAFVIAFAWLTPQAAPPLTATSASYPSASYP